MHRFLLIAVVFPFITLADDENKPESDPQLTLDRIYVKKEFDSKSYSLKWLEPGQGYVRQEKSRETKDAQDIFQYGHREKENSRGRQVLDSQGPKEAAEIERLHFHQRLG